jgi:uncharacterized protein (DUF433 family)
MAAVVYQQPTIIRTERGLAIAGTRITLYQIMDYLKAEWSPKRIRDWHNFTEQQIDDVMAYIAEHKAEVEVEYQQVLQEAEEIRRYWEERNRERFARIAALPPKPGQEAIRAKLEAHKTNLKDSPE